MFAFLAEHLGVDHICPICCCGHNYYDHSNKNKDKAVLRQNQIEKKIAYTVFV